MFKEIVPVECLGGEVISTLLIGFAFLETSFNSNEYIEKCSNKLAKEVTISAKTSLNEQVET